MEFVHVPVMLEEAVGALAPKPDGIYIDGTAGGAGHSYEIAKRLSGKGRLFCFDTDEAAVSQAKRRLAEFADRTEVLHDTYDNAVRVLKEKEVDGADGVLLDLGVSSYQIDDPRRGFSYMKDGPLDMRMDPSAGRTAADIVNEASAGELERLFREYGEEKQARRIALRIEKRREDTPILTTFQLNEVIYEAVPSKARVKASHPSKRVFQALRIACNGELEGLERALREMIPFLKPGGRLAVITFHSLEDRIVKNAFRNAANPCTCPKEFPVCVCGKVSAGRVVTGKPVLPGEEETTRNPRAKSAKLRVFEKSGEAVSPQENRK